MYYLKHGDSMEIFIDDTRMLIEATLSKQIIDYIKNHKSEINDITLTGMMADYYVTTSQNYDKKMTMFDRIWRLVRGKSTKNGVSTLAVNASFLEKSNE